MEDSIRKLTDILEEATEDENSVCYVTDVDADALKDAITALKVLDRFVIEPRSSYMYNHDEWLVVYDKQTKDYIREGKSYKRFNHSTEVYNYLKGIV